MGKAKLRSEVSTRRKKRTLRLIAVEKSRSSSSMEEQVEPWLMCVDQKGCRGCTGRRSRGAEAAIIAGAAWGRGLAILHKLAGVR